MGSSHTKLLFLLPLMATFLSLPAQQRHDHDHSHDHHHKHHEIALGTGAVYMPHEKAWGFGAHLHGLAAINHWMSAGGGYELIAGEHQHHTLTALLHFHPIHPLDINVGPGLVFPDEENPSYRFKAHMEIAAVFELGEHLHLGPSVDMGVGKHDLHFTFGIHVGWAFSAGE